MVSKYTEDPTLTTHGSLPTTEDTLPSFDTDLHGDSFDSEISDQEFVDEQESTEVRSKIKLCSQIVTIL